MAIRRALVFHADCERVRQSRRGYLSRASLFATHPAGDARSISRTINVAPAAAIRLLRAFHVGTSKNKTAAFRILCRLVDFVQLRTSRRVTRGRDLFCCLFIDEIHLSFVSSLFSNYRFSIGFTEYRISSIYISLRNFRTSFFRATVLRYTFSINLRLYYLQFVATFLLTLHPDCVKHWQTYLCIKCCMINLVNKSDLLFQSENEWICLEKWNVMTSDVKWFEKINNITVRRSRYYSTCREII